MNEFVAFLYGGDAKASLDKAGSQVGPSYDYLQGSALKVFSEPKDNDKNQSKQSVKHMHSVRQSTA